MWSSVSFASAHRGRARPRVRRVVAQPINLTFAHLHSRRRTQAWRHEHVSARAEACITGFGEYANLVLVMQKRSILKQSQENDQVGSC